MKEAVCVLDDPRVVEGRPDLKAQITWDLLPFLVVTGAEPECVELQLASCVAGTTLISQHPLTKGWTKGNYSDVIVKFQFIYSPIPSFPVMFNL